MTTTSYTYTLDIRTSSPPQIRLILDPPLLVNLKPELLVLHLPVRLLERRERDLRWVEHDPPII